MTHDFDLKKMGLTELSVDEKLLVEGGDLPWWEVVLGAIWQVSNPAAYQNIATGIIQGASLAH